ncbi:MAG: hypothetical protein ACJA0I_001478 [Gammaproteobacteria bacterium]|jgi:hypothetical protein
MSHLELKVVLDELRNTAALDFSAARSALLPFIITLTYCH